MYFYNFMQTVYIHFRFNEQLEIIFDLLRKAENIKLAPELLDPEPPRNFNDPRYPLNTFIKLSVNKLII